MLLLSGTLMRPNSLWRNSTGRQHCFLFAAKTKTQLPCSIQQKKLKESKRKQKESEGQNQVQKENREKRKKTTLKINGGEDHVFSDVSLRRLKTSYCLRMNTYLEIKQVPTLRLMGNWLRKAEFEIGDYATLVVSKGLIVIRREENTED